MKTKTTCLCGWQKAKYPKCPQVSSFDSSFALHSLILSNATNSHKLPEFTLSTKFLPFRSCTRLLNSPRWPSSFHSPNSYVHTIQFTPNLMSQVIVLSFDFWSLEWSEIQFMLFRCNIVLMRTLTPKFKELSKSPKVNFCHLRKNWKQYKVLLQSSKCWKSHFPEIRIPVKIFLFSKLLLATYQSS